MSERYTLGIYFRTDNTKPKKLNKFRPILNKKILKIIFGCKNYLVNIMQGQNNNLQSNVLQQYFFLIEFLLNILVDPIFQKKNDGKTII